MEIKGYDAWLTHNPDAEIEDTFCPDCNASAEVVEDADEDGIFASIECASCKAREKGEISISLLEDIELDGIDFRDAPDFVDAFVKSAKWIDYPDGSDPNLTEEQLCRISSEDIHDLVHKRLH